MSRRLVVPALIVASLVAAGCAKPLAAPTAAATAASATVAVGAVVQLDGSQSSDPNSPALPLAYHWRFAALPPGSLAKLNEPSVANPSFTADVAGAYDVELTVSSAARTSDPSVVRVTAGPCGANAPAVGALTASPAAPGVGAIVQLTAAVTDADTAAPCSLSQTLAYAWRIVKLPAGSRAALNQRDAQNPSFTVDVAGDYLVELVATDSTGRSSAPAQLTITASSCGAAAPSATVTATPVAPAVAQPVALKAVVTDADNTAPCSAGQTFTYAWSLTSAPAGSKAALNLPGGAQPSFAPDLPGAYVASLVVTDSTGRSSAPVSVTVTASTCGSNAPSAAVVAAPSQLGVGMAAQLTATVTDADNGTTCQGATPTQYFSYQWTLLSAPAGSAAALSSATSAAPSLVPDLPGNYLARVVVTDSTGLKSVPVDTTVVASACGSNAPTISSVGPATGAVQQPVSLQAAFSDADNEATCQAVLGAPQSFSYRWTVAGAPAGSRAAIVNPTALSPGFTPDVPGPYSLAFTVTDSTGRSATSVATLTVGTCGSNAPTVAPTLDAASVLQVNGLVMLHANAADVDNAAPCSANQTFTYRWYVSEAPPGGSTAGANFGVKDLSFSPGAAGTYVLGVVATDSTGRSSAAGLVSVAVTTCGSATPVAMMTTARAGNCFTGGGGGGCTVNAVVSQPSPPNVLVTAIPTNAGWQAFSVQLDASASISPDTQAPCSLRRQLLYQWEIVAAPFGGNWNWQPGGGGGGGGGGGFGGTSSSLVNPTLELFDKGTYVLVLRVSDGTRWSAPIQVQVQTN